jgi:hypothetical protein
LRWSINDSASASCCLTRSTFDCAARSCASYSGDDPSSYRNTEPCGACVAHSAVISLQCCVSGAASSFSRICAAVMALYSVSPKYPATTCCNTASSLHVGWETAGVDTTKTPTVNPNMARIFVLYFSMPLIIIPAERLKCRTSFSENTRPPDKDQWRTFNLLIARKSAF